MTTDEILREYSDFRIGYQVHSVGVTSFEPKGILRKLNKVPHKISAYFDAKLIAEVIWVEPLIHLVKQSIFWGQVLAHTDLDLNRWVKIKNALVIGVSDICGKPVLRQSNIGTRNLRAYRKAQYRMNHCSCIGGGDTPPPSKLRETTS